MSEVSTDKEEENMEYYTCTVSFKNILRRDVNPIIAKTFLPKVNAVLYNVSDCTTNIQLVAFTLMLSIKSSQFMVARNGDVKYTQVPRFFN
jgi:hypothetical protein